MSCVRLYHNNGFLVPVSSFEQLKGRTIIWDQPSNARGEEAGFLYVQEHEEVTKGTIEPVDVDEDHIQIHWYGTANVYWKEQYGEDVPFDVLFHADLPKQVPYVVDVFQSTSIAIDKQTTLQLLNLPDFNQEVLRVSKSREWDTFHTVLKFQLIQGEKSYAGKVTFTNGKENHVTELDEDCPLPVTFAGVDFNLAAMYEVFSFLVG